MKISTTDPAAKLRFSCVLFIIVASTLIGQTISQMMISGDDEPRVPALKFLEFSNNSRMLPNDDVDIASEIFIPNGFPFGETVHYSAFIGDNGVISFGQQFLLYIPRPFPGSLTVDVVAPYWSDNDITREGSVIYEVFQSESSAFEDMTLATVNNFIKEFDSSTSFQGTYMILAEWRDVHPFPHGAVSGLTANQQAFTDLTNTYQAIVITDLEESFAIFTYDCEELQWTGLDNGPTIGFVSITNNMFANHHLTGQLLANQIACDPNPDINTIMYPIGKVDRPLARSCVNWYRSDINTYGTPLIILLDQILQSCPCSLFQALDDPRFLLTFVPNKTSFCFIQRFQNFRIQFGLAIRECCYDTTFGALLTATQNGGSLLLSYVPNESLQQNNRVPQQECCAPGVGLCDLYYERRPSDSCGRYVPLLFSWFWGDPHFTTLDGYAYTFNGIGEYVLVRAMEDDIEFQARTKLVENSNATAFSAFAISHNNTRVQVSGEFTILVNGINVSSNLAMVGSEFPNTTSSYLLQRLAIDSLRLSFSSGVTLTTNVTDGILNFVLNLPPTLNGQTEGLLGTLNGNQSDDLIFRNGTLLPITSRDADKHVFGQSWQLNETESIFEYMPGENVSTFSDPNHVPPFLDEIRDNLEANSTLTDICGNNTECLYDFAQTGNEAVGMATMEFMEAVVEDVIMSETFPPSISAPNVFMATIGTNSVYSFTITGRVVDVNVIINGQNFVINEENAVINTQNTPSLPPNTNLNRNGEIFAFTWSPVDVNQQINVTIIANGERDTTSMFSPRVQLCGCENGGNCTEVGIADLEASFVLLNCDCPEAYNGRLCEDDADGCEAISCLPDQNCTDVPAPGTGAMCACPHGYIVINSKCVDIDECNSTMHDCNELQTCMNTAGSFMCSCRPGYTASLTSPLLCEDVDECNDGTSRCHQNCTNTNGSFVCSCRPQFVLQPDQTTCNVSENATCPPNSTMCQQVCYLDDVTAAQTCDCNPGYALDANNITCSDIDECLTNNGGCSQNCNNMVGSFSCSCNDRFNLDEDGRTCSDVNECQTALPMCPGNFLCSNLIGSFECVCPPGTTISSNRTECVIPDPPSPSTTTSTTTSSSVMPSETPTIDPVVTSDQQSDGLSGGEIAAIVIGSVFGAALLLAVIVITALWINHQRKSKSVDFITGQRGRSTGSLRRRPVSTVIAAHDE